jgi:hypothetical protein
MKIGPTKSELVLRLGRIIFWLKGRGAIRHLGAAAPVTYRTSTQHTLRTWIKVCRLRSGRYAANKRVCMSVLKGPGPDKPINLDLFRPRHEPSPFFISQLIHATPTFHREGQSACRMIYIYIHDSGTQRSPHSPTPDPTTTIVRCVEKSSCTSSWELSVRPSGVTCGARRGEGRWKRQPQSGPHMFFFAKPCQRLYFAGTIQSINLYSRMAELRHSPLPHWGAPPGGAQAIARHPASSCVSFWRTSVSQKESGRRSSLGMERQRLQVPKGLSARRGSSAGR